MSHKTLQWFMLCTVTSAVLFGGSLAVIRTNSDAVVSHGIFEGLQKHQIHDQNDTDEVILIDEYYVYHVPKLAWELFVSSVAGMLVSGIFLLRYDDEGEE